MTRYFYDPKNPPRTAEEWEQAFLYQEKCKSVREKVVKELRSGKHKQAPPGVYVEGGEGLNYYQKTQLSFDQERGVCLAGLVRRVTGYGTRKGLSLPNGQESALVAMNDSRIPFDKMADYIEKQPYRFYKETKPEFRRKKK